MRTRTISCVLAIAALSLGTTLASASDQFEPANNESGVKLRPQHPVPSTKSRDQVKQELKAAREDGSLQDIGDDPDYPHATDTPAVPGKSRAEVKRELQAWKANPVTADGYREVNGDIGLAPVR